MNGKVSVIGGGAWGTAVALLLADKGLAVSLWAYEAELCDDINLKRENTLFLPGVSLSPNITATNNLKEGVSGASTVILASPSHVLRGVVERIKEHIDPQVNIVCLTKGIELDTLKLPSQILDDILPADISRRSAYLSGPTFAKEVARKLPTAATIASKDEDAAHKMQHLFNTDYFRTYRHSDVLGVELGGALKNVIAIGAGISDGMGNGHNALSSLITRGLAEMIRFGTALGADPVTFTGLSGMGDLVLTCTGDLSRNRTVGMRLGKGETLDNIIGEMKMVAEGVKTTKSAMALSKKYDVELPIIGTIYSILYDGQSPKEAIRQLMRRGLKEEF
ncbi:MAG: NAD(P)H-dependent glycerol-3-phosphate dehydrogenase [Nitrospinota bacterium]